MNNVRVSLDHPILFIADFANRQMVIPRYLPDKIVSATGSCISIRAITYLDGDVSVCLSQGEACAATGHVEVFRGEVATPSKKIAIISSENERIAELDVEGDSTMVRVMVNDTAYPSVLLVQVV